MKYLTRMKHWTVLLLVLTMILSAVPVYATDAYDGTVNPAEVAGDDSESGGPIETLAVTESIVYAGANGSKTTSDAFTGLPAVGGGFEMRKEQWAWTGKLLGCEQYPAYTSAEGASFTFDMGTMVPGVYEVAYFTLEQANAPEMTLEVKEGDSAVGTVTVPGYSEGNKAGWLTVGTVKVAGTDKVTVNYVNTPVQSNARATGVKLTLLENTVSDGDIVKNAMNTDDCSRSDDDDHKWNISDSIKNFDGSKTLHCTKAGATLTFNTEGVASGNYKVYYWVTPHKYNLSEMKMTFTHNSKTSDISVPMGADASAGWYYMGTLDFSGDGTEKIEFVHPGEAQARGTAIKLVPTEHGVYIPPEEIDEEEPPVVEPPVVDPPVVDPPVTPPEDGDSEKLIDSDPYPGFSFVGDWSASGALKGPMSKVRYSMWTSKERIDNSQEPYNVPAMNYCQYKPDIQVTGGVAISVYLLYWHTNQANDIIYEVHHNGEVDTFHIDLTQLTESCWYDLGTFDFSGPEESNFVRIVCTDANNYDVKTNFRASAIRFDILNSAADGSVWQSIYVTPSPTAEIYNVADLNQFEDITADDAAKYDVEYMYNEGYVTGTTETIFSPNENITKADFISYLSKVLGLSEADASVVEALMEDIDENEILTKEEVAKILYNAVIYLNKNVMWLHSLNANYTELSDADDVSEWAKNAIDVLYRCGVVTTTNGVLAPQKVLTRAEAVVMLKQFTQQFINAGPVNDDGEDWILTFNDEFLGTELNTNVWKARNDNPGTILSSRHAENVTVYDGAVRLMTKNESRVEGKSWTTALIEANKGAFAQEYGYWECRYKFTEASGINNSFWLVSPGEKTPQFYEIDICEGHYMNKINNTLHEFTSGSGNNPTKRFTTQYDLSADYHTYAVEWTPDTIKYYFDGEMSFETDNPIIGGRLTYPTLSTAVLNWAGTITSEADGTAMIVDYVRVWQRSGDITEHTNATEQALDHMTGCILEKMEGTDPTCTNTGYKEHWKCTICNKRFADAAGATEIDIADVTVVALGGEHEYEITESSASSCLEAGYKVETCTKCGDKKTTEIPVVDHTTQIVPGKDATCTESGLTDGEKCSVCGTVTIAQTEIPVIAHTVVLVPGKAATCTEPGLTDGEKCSVCGTVITAQTEIPVVDDSDKDVEENPAENETEDMQTSDEVDGSSYVDSHAPAAEVPHTGDTFESIWLLMLALSVVGVVVLIMKQKKWFAQ